MGSAGQCARAGWTSRGRPVSYQTYFCAVAMFALAGVVHFTPKRSADRARLPVSELRRRISAERDR